MPALAAVVADLLARPRPVLCLDTCDLLDVIQCVAEGKARRLEHVRRLLDTLALCPDRVQLIVSYLVPVERAQNQASVLADVQPVLPTPWPYSSSRPRRKPPSDGKSGPISGDWRCCYQTVLTCRCVDGSGRNPFQQVGFSRHHSQEVDATLYQTYSNDTQASCRRGQEAVRDRGEVPPGAACTCLPRWILIAGRFQAR